MDDVIVHYLDSRESQTGKVQFLNLAKTTFPLQVRTGDGRIETLTVRLDEIKKINFLREERPEPSSIRRETIDQSTFAGTVALRVSVELRDGEVITGSTLKYDPNEKGFFVTPLNPADASERIYISARAVRNVFKNRLMGKILLDEKKIETLMVERAMIEPEQLEESLARQKDRNLRLGSLLIEAGYITREQLETALHIQGEDRTRKLGQVLVGLKYLTPNDICLALASQIGCAWVDLAAIRIPPDVRSLLPADEARRLEVVPVELKGDGTLVVASAMPQDPLLMERLSALTSLKIELVVAYDGYIPSA